MRCHLKGLLPVWHAAEGMAVTVLIQIMQSTVTTRSFVTPSVTCTTSAATIRSVALKARRESLPAARLKGGRHKSPSQGWIDTYAALIYCFELSNSSIALRGHVSTRSRKASPIARLLNATNNLL